MIEEINQKKPKKVKNKAEKILEANAHPIILFYETLFVICIFYSLYYKKISLIIGLIMLLASFFMTYYNYYKRKVVVTSNKFYFYRLGKKTISLSFSYDFFQIKYEKTKLGRILNYGTLILIDQKNQYYKINFISNPEEIFFCAIKEYEKVQLKINPNYEIKFTENKENIDKIEDEKTDKINN